MYKLDLTEEELNFIYDRCFNKSVHLEDLNLTDTPCYSLAVDIMFKIKKLKKLADENKTIEK